MALTRRRAEQFIEALLKLRENVSDEQAYEVPPVYPEWKEDIEYKVGERILYDNVLYKVLTSHFSQTDWTPIAAPSLFAKVLIPDVNEIPTWEQPDSTNPYMTGDKVRHNDKIWVSNCDDNVWEPGAYGWEEVIN